MALMARPYLALLVTILCLTQMFMFIRSKYGRSIKAIRDDEIAASASGINTSFYKIMTFAYSAFFAGVAGALYACANATLSTSSFAFTNGGILNSTFIVVMVVLGGMGSLTGSVVAAVIMFLVNYQIKNGAWVAALPAAVQGEMCIRDRSRASSCCWPPSPSLESSLPPTCANTAAFRPPWNIWARPSPCLLYASRCV